MGITADKIRGCFLLGACGDTLGAPLEEIRSLDEIVAKCGPEGLRDILPFDNVFGTGVSYPAGRVTDDTTMAMTTAAALLLAKNPADWHEVKPLLWQGYLQWGARQEDGAALAAKADKTVAWDSEVQKFWFFCGAGRGTIAALLQDKPGSVEEPIDYDCTIRGKPTKGPNAGCGGMMRVAPQALLDLPPEKIFELGCQNAALTHGHQDAYVATGIIALFIHFAAQDLSMKETLQKTSETLDGFRKNPAYKDGIKACEAALDLAGDLAAVRPGKLQVMDDIPQGLGYKNAFLAVPVLGQTAYALLSAESATDAAGIKKAMALTVSHSGDSDSLGAIVGNVLGARHGTGVIPKEWLDVLMQRADIEKMADRVQTAIEPPARTSAPCSYGPYP